MIKIIMRKCTYMTYIAVSVLAYPSPSLNMSLCMTKPTIWVSDQVQHKPACTVTEETQNLENLGISSENKDADQLRGHREADLRLCFRLCRLLVFPCSGSNIICSIDYERTAYSVCESSFYIYQGVYFLFMCLSVMAHGLHVLVPNS